MSGAERLQRQDGTKRSLGDEGITLVEDTGAMVNEIPRFVTQARVSYLLAIPEEEVRRISREAGLGRVERAGDEEVTYFTYEEFDRLGMLASQNPQERH